MHLYARKQPGEHKNGGPAWGLIWAVWKDGKLKHTRVPQHEYVGLGLPPELTFAEARARVKTINAQETLKTRAIKRTAINKRLDEEELVESAFLTKEDAAEFERRILLARMTPEEAKGKKLLAHWRACKRAILVVALDVSEWNETPYKFYDYWKNEKLSLSYVKKLIPILNQWGFFQAKKYKKPFLELPAPNSLEANKISRAYLDENVRGNDSDPITPAKLEAQKGNFNELQYNWLFLSVWFGLRPLEIDGLKKESSKLTWYIETDNQGTNLLWIYQTKLVRLSDEKRLKQIPCILPEQNTALDILRSGKFKRPLVKTLKKYFTEYTNCYGGRKGFCDLMLDHGQSLEDASLMLGHTTLDQTFKNYKNRQRVRYKKVS